MYSHGKGLSAQGRDRSNNEDALHVDDELGLYLVCDGAGGHASGEVASAIALHAVVDTYARQTALITRVRQGKGPHGALEQLAQQAADHAAQRVHYVERSSPHCAGMGTTMTLLNVVDDKAVVAHVGDSRAYLQRQGLVRQLTTDHTVTAMLVQRGHISPGEQAQRAYRNYLTRALGMAPPVPVQTRCFRVMPGDRLLLCSDGLSDHLEGAQALVTHLQEDLDTIPQTLADLARRAGGGDDITAIAVGIQSTSRQTAPHRLRTDPRQLQAASHKAPHLA